MSTSAESHLYEVRLGWWEPTYETFVVEAIDADVATAQAKNTVRDRQARNVVCITESARRLQTVEAR